MGVNYFSDEQVALLKDNPYIEKITNKSIKYSIKFKEEFWKRYSQGELPSAIVQSFGIDPKILGNSRLSNIVQRIKMDTSMAGSSEYFKGSVVAYCNTVKHNVLGVSSEDLEKYGAVSKPVVEQMANGACRVLDCECAVATSGIAGPGGGSAEKPVGTVWIAAAFKSKVVSECFHFEHDRAGNIEASANTALRMLCELIAGVMKGE